VEAAMLYHMGPALDDDGDDDDDDKTSMRAMTTLQASC